MTEQKIDNVVVRTIKRIFTINKKVIKDEIEEIKNLEITGDDIAQAEALTNVVCLALAGMGIPVGMIGRKTIQIALTYGIRDLKDGIDNPCQLVAGRVIEEVKKTNAYKFNKKDLAKFNNSTDSE